MKLIYVDAGRSGILVPFAEIAPIGGVYIPEITQAISDRYAFSQPPNFSPELVEKNGLVFGMGKLSTTGKAKESVSIRTLSLYRDGIIADCFSTEDAASVTDDLLSWMADKFSFRRFSPAPDHIHVVSNVVVEFEVSAAKAFDRFDGLFKLASELFQTRYGLEREVSMSRFAFDIDPTTVGGPIANAPMFIIERQINQPFTSNRFWCQAPIHTQDHIRLLEQFEALL